ncbi:MAG: hypothetical protein K1565_15785 [Candidatus Thiodiazotropha sp. (ex. Lucinisca nassula)]|nr:hypothetical protein [Candidatus Thiodiazotropha sp. (ex. Lucinisca nassula)]
MRRYIVWSCVFILLIISGCFYSNTDFVRVEPGKHVPVPENTKPNTTYGWVKVNRSEAKGFMVRVGNLTYKRIIKPYMVNGDITFEAAVSAFAAFAEKEVERRDYCESAFVPEKARKLYGSNTQPEMNIYVECRR